MTDLELWYQGVAAVRDEFAALPPSLHARLKELAESIKVCKNAVHAIPGTYRGDDICAACQGECCVTGKHHFTVIDLLIYLVGDTELFVPRFDNGLCPFLGDAGCLMAAEYRPYNCITFICERVEEPIEPWDKELFYLTGRQLLALYREVEELFDNRFMNGLLITGERALREGGTPILRR